MRKDSRLWDVLHVLLHMAEHERSVTSEALARVIDTNPVVVRRLMAGLRELGYVHSEKGHGGGWSLSCDLTRVTLRDIYQAVGSPALLAIGNREDSSGCLVGQVVHEALDDAYGQAEALLLARLGKVTLARLSAALHKRLAVHVGHHDLEHVHAD